MRSVDKLHQLLDRDLDLLLLSHGRWICPVGGELLRHAGHERDIALGWLELQVIPPRLHSHLHGVGFAAHRHDRDL